MNWSQNGHAMVKPLKADTAIIRSEPRLTTYIRSGTSDTIFGESVRAITSRKLE